jgi:rhodanese-related sulfurtransferase
MKEIMEIDAEKLQRMITLHVSFTLIDVRDSKTFAASHIRGAKNLPGPEFMGKLGEIVAAKESAVVVYDEDGTTVEDLVAKAFKKGYINTVFLESGIAKFKDLFPRLLENQ